MRNSKLLLLLRFEQELMEKIRFKVTEGEICSSTLYYTPLHVLGRLQPVLGQGRLLPWRLITQPVQVTPLDWLIRNGKVSQCTLPCRFCLMWLSYIIWSNVTQFPDWYNDTKNTNIRRALVVNVYFHWPGEKVRSTQSAE